MNKTEFLDALRRALGKLPASEVEQSCAFYAEAIDDRVEEGMTQEAAVAALGDVEAVAAQIVAEAPLVPKAIAKADTGSRALNIVLLALLSPVWAPLAFSFAVLALCLYLTLWLLVGSLWVVVAALVLCAPLGLFVLVWAAAIGYPLSGVWVFGCGLAAAGLGLFSWFGARAATKGLVKTTRSFSRWFKGLFVKLNRPKATSAAREGAAHV